jgi:hypothetical protein
MYNFLAAFIIFCQYHIYIMFICFSLFYSHWFLCVVLCNCPIEISKKKCETFNLVILVQKKKKKNHLKS